MLLLIDTTRLQLDPSRSVSGSTLRDLATFRPGPPVGDRPGSLPLAPVRQRWAGLVPA